MGKVQLKGYNKSDVTFSNSKEIPFQRWYPYIEGYSPNFVLNLIDEYCNDSTLIYEPFAGTGTTLFASDSRRINTVYSEVNPLLRFLIKTKVAIMTMGEQQRIELATTIKNIENTIIDDAQVCQCSNKLADSYLQTFGNSIYFSKEQYDLILKLRTYIDNLYESKQELLADIISIAVFASLLPVSLLKKQGDVRFKTEKEKLRQEYLNDVLPAKLKQIVEDISNMNYVMTQQHTLLCDNAKCVGNSAFNAQISAVITSPPYLNGTNYFRNTKLELWFLGYINNGTDLRHYRDEALTSGINDVKTAYNNECAPLNSKLLADTLSLLDTKAYDKRIPLMVRCYFNEMKLVFGGLTKLLKNNANVLIDLGDSIFCDIHIKTDEILVEVLKNIGYTLIKKKVLRQRRSRNGELLSQVLLVMKYHKENAIV